MPPLISRVNKFLSNNPASTLTELIDIFPEAKEATLRIYHSRFMDRNEDLVNRARKAKQGKQNIDDLRAYLGKWFKRNQRFDIDVKKLYEIYPFIPREKVRDTYKDWVMKMRENIQENGDIIPQIKGDKNEITLSFLEKVVVTSLRNNPSDPQMIRQALDILKMKAGEQGKDLQLTAAEVMALADQEITEIK